MKQIDEFVDSIYANVSGKEAKELKEEMHSHLIEAVTDLKTEGKTEQEAIDIAINRFGDKKQISRGLSSLFETNNKLIKNLFKISVISLSIGLIVFLGLMWGETKQQNFKETVNDIAKIMTVGELSEQRENKIHSLVEETDEIESFILYKNPDPSTAVAKKEIKDKWQKVMEIGRPLPAEESNYGWVKRKDTNERWYYEIEHEKQLDMDKLYAIPFGLFIVFIMLGIISLFLKMNLNRKMLKAFLN